MNKNKRNVHPLYHTWWNMKRRCLNTEDSGYKNYGGRGIKVCDRWLVFENFKTDMYESYLEHYEKYGKRNTTIDRKDNSKNYCQENCRWSTPREQCNNRRSNVFIFYNNREQTLANWARELGIGTDTLWLRLYKYGMTPEQALVGKRLSPPIVFLKFNGRSMPIREWSNEIGIKISTIKTRRQLGWSDEKIITTPVYKQQKTASR